MSNKHIIITYILGLITGSVLTAVEAPRLINEAIMLADRITARVFNEHLFIVMPIAFLAVFALPVWVIYIEMRQVPRDECC